MINKLKGIGFFIGLAVIDTLTFIEKCVRKFKSFITKCVIRLDPRSLEEQTQSFRDSMHRQGIESLSEKG